MQSLARKLLERLTGKTLANPRNSAGLESGLFKLAKRLPARISRGLEIERCKSEKL